MSRDVNYTEIDCTELSQEECIQYIMDKQKEILNAMNNDLNELYRLTSPINNE